MITILMLEDETSVAKATIQTYMEFSFKWVKNLLDLHGEIERMRDGKYDFILLDIGIDLGNIPLRAYKEAIPEMFSKDGVACPLSEFDGNRLYGWDYFTRVIWPDERFAQIKTTKIALVTAFSSLLDKYKLLDNYPNVKVVRKRGRGAYEELKNTIRWA